MYSAGGRGEEEKEFVKGIPNPYLCTKYTNSYGMKNLPLGIQHFDQLIEKDCIYVDKTQQLHQLINDFQAAFLSPPLSIVGK